MKNINLLLLVIISNLTFVFSQTKINSKSPLPPVPDYVTVKYFEKFLNRTSSEIKSVFKKSDYKLITTQEAVMRGYASLIGMNENCNVFLIPNAMVSNGRISDLYVLVVYSRQNRCNMVWWNMNYLLFKSYQREIRESGYKDSNGFVTEGIRSFCFKNQKHIIVCLTPESKYFTASISNIN